MNNGRRVIDLTGKKFGKLCAVKLVKTIPCKGAVWLCKCDCGGEKEVLSSYLSSGGTRSCGCIIGKNNIFHGLSGTGTYRSWNHMKQRCLNPNDDAYEQYGGRGITIHQPWIDSFEEFVKDMGIRPPKTTIDRIDNDGPYSPANCRWAGYEKQNNNLSSNILISYKGETKTCMEWAKKFGLSWACLSSRIKRGWEPEKALLTPADKKYYNGKKK